MSFDLREDFLAGPVPVDVEATDFDRDGRVDLAATIHENDLLSLLLNLGSGQELDFAIDDLVGTGLHPQGLAIADLDGDDLPDVVSANSGRGGGGSLSVYQNLSSPGRIRFLRVFNRAAETAHRAAIGDFNQDDKPDVVVSLNSVKVLHVLPNTSTVGNLSLGPETVLTGGDQLSAIAVGDLDGDDREDIAVSVENLDRIEIFLNDTSPGSPTLSFVPAVSFPAGDAPDGIAIGDLDGDEVLDLAVANVFSDTVSVFLNRSTPGVLDMERHVFTVRTNPRNVLLEDFDADGRVDVAVTQPELDQVSVLVNRTVGTTLDFELLSPALDAGDTPILLTAARLDEDDLLDLVVANHRESTVSVFRNALPLCAGDVSSGDADGDGFCDREDNCPGEINCDQADGDGDGAGDVCDLCAGDDASGDVDADGVCDDRDNCVDSPNADQADADADGAGDVCDRCPGFDDAADADADGVPDGCDGCRGDDASGDADGDGVCADEDCDDADPAAVLVDRCGVCGGDGSTCAIFEDGFESGDVSSWSGFRP